MIKKTAFLIAIVLVLLILLIFSTYVPVFVSEKAMDRRLDPKIPLSIKKRYKFSESEQHNGQVYWKQNKVIICGMLRDAECALSYMKSQMMELASYYQDYIILIVENDSTDSTRVRLLEWSKRDPKVHILGCNGINLETCKLDLDRTQWHSQCPIRISKMARLRNIYVNYIRDNNLEKEYQYTVVCDADLKGTLYKEGVLDTGNLFSINDMGENLDSRIDVITANGWFVVADHFFPCYADAYAHEELEDSTPFKSQPLPPLFHFWNRRLLGIENPARKVKSAFGGLAIYRTTSLAQNQYSSAINANGTAVCEHKMLHEKMNVWFNPKLLFLFTANPLL